MTGLRYAFRSLAQSPGFAAIAILALGLGLGLSTTMFAVLDAVVNPYMPYRDPDTLFPIRWWWGRTRTQIGTGDLYHAVKNETQSFAAIVPYSGSRLVLETTTDSREIMVARVTPEFFTVTGVRLWLGRAFVGGDMEDVVVVGNDLWRRVYGRRRSLDGATLSLGGRTYTVVGVMPRGASAPAFASAWLPLSPSDYAAGAIGAPLVRLKPGVTIERAQAELQGLGALMTARHSDVDRPINFGLMPIRERREEIKDIHKAMVGAALSVLIVACVNLAHLMLARGLSRRRELALRMALGAGRSAVVWQVFAECAVITAGGAVLGALGAVWGTDILINRMPQEVSWIGLMQPQLSWRVFSVSALAAVASSVLFGLVPGIRVATAVSLDEPLKDGAGTTGRHRGRYSPLVVGEIAIALVLMMGGGLLLRTIHQLRSVHFTFDTRTLLTAQASFRRGSSDTSKIMRRDAVVALIAEVPGVQEVAYEGIGRTVGGAVTAEMVGDDSTRTINTHTYDVVSWQYLRVHGLALLKGRDFEPGDAAGNAMAILNPVAAHRLYGRGEAVGKMIKLGSPAHDAPWVTVVGIARSPMELQGDDNHATQPMVLVVGGDGPIASGRALIRTERNDPRIAVDVRRKLNSEPSMWYSSVEPFAFARDSELASRRFLAKAFVMMGALALALAVLGLYSALAYAVNQRMREFAVRLALGAEPMRLFRMVMHDGAVMVLAGTAIGAFGALLASRLLDAVLTNVLPSDVTSLVACEVVLIGAGLTAAVAPARRALRADPLDILRAV